ncbi:MAG: DUF4097 family beta strand repeat-containing protein [Acidimicrobiales bacterium]
MEWSFASAGPIEANVELAAGRVDLQPRGDNEIEVALEPMRASSRRAAELIEAATVVFENGRLRVKVPTRAFNNADLLCTIALPEGSSISVSTASADVRSAGRTGDFHANTASGDVTLEQVDGELMVNSASGDLRCRQVASRLKMKGASSDVVIGSVGGPVDLVLASGDVDIDVAGSSVKVHTASGDLHLGRVEEGEITVRTASGDIAIGVAPGVGAYLDVASLSGDMTCTLPFQEAVAGDAKLRITCQTGSGDVRIHAASA